MARRSRTYRDLPPHEELARLAVPTLVLAWPEDASHPLKVSEELVGLLPDARLSVARSPAEVAAWPEEVATFINARSTGGISDASGAPRFQ